ncbi:aKG-HExxH-type peptide beta-hydroxylase [Actinoplanes sp. NPDC026623]|uniref:aKG-HExxH-type peptide beta-hydroxylase n=1 Tax=Actinoplanes sp. NPDC026623 TaxID=3155610 RepID=UPI0033F7DECC
MSGNSRFAESAPLLARVDATYSLLGEVAIEAGDATPNARVALSGPPLADDPVLRRSLDLLLAAKRRGAGADATLAALDVPGFAPLPGARDIAGTDCRFVRLSTPAQTALHVLAAVDDGDPWTAELHALFREVLGNPGQRYDLAGADVAETAALQGAVELLATTLPRTSRSVLAHTSLVVLVDGPDAFESATDRRIPRAVFLSRDAVTDPVRAAEALLHESAHQKLYDLQLIYQLYRPDYDAGAASTVSPPWHNGNAQWSFDRGVAACHVYTHLHAFFAALVRAPQGSAVDVSGSARQAADRARFLHGALLPQASRECNDNGRAFLHWIGDCLNSTSR